MTANADSAAAPQDFRVLVVDDEPAILEVMAEVLETAGWKVDAESSPLAALTKAKRRVYDALVLDLYMPEMPGLLVHAKLKMIDPELVNRTVFVSGHFSSEDLRRELEGTPRFVPKPFRIEILVGAVGLALPDVPRATRIPPPAVNAASASDRPAGTRGRS
jgi:CheY-like chemotaxis protein